MIESKNIIIQTLLKANGLFEQQLISMELIPSHGNNKSQNGNQNGLSHNQDQSAIVVQLQAENQHLSDNISEMERELVK